MWALPEYLTPFIKFNSHELAQYIHLIHILKDFDFLVPICIKNKHCLDLPGLADVVIYDKIDEEIIYKIQFKHSSSNRHISFNEKSKLFTKYKDFNNSLIYSFKTEMGFNNNLWMNDNFFITTKSFDYMNYTIPDSYFKIQKLIKKVTDLNKISILDFVNDKNTYIAKKLNLEYEYQDILKELENRIKINIK